MTVYTVIGYKASCADSVKGCVLKLYPSEFEMYSFSDLASAANVIAELSTEPPVTKYVDYSWEIKVLIDGAEQGHHGFILGEDTEQKYSSLFEELNNAVAMATRKIEQERENKARIEAEKAAKILAEKRKKQEEQIKEQELQMLEILKEKYETR